jgi:VanZ family protein
MGRGDRVIFLIAARRPIRLSSAVLKFKSFLKYWLLPLLWMLVIFSASSDARSYEHSSRLFEPLLHWLFPQMSQVHVEAIHHVFRKCGHLTEYAIFAALLWRALYRPARNQPRPWSWQPARAALLIVALYSASDEFHQLFVPTRTSLVSDVFIDTTGGAIGLLVIWGLGRWRKRW